MESVGKDKAILARVTVMVKPARRKQDLHWGQGFEGLPHPAFSIEYSLGALTGW